MIGSGYPIHAEGEVGELYPPNLFLFRFFSPIIAFNFSIFLHFALGLFGMYFLLKELGLGVLASFTGSLIFGFNTFSVNYIEHLNKIQGIAWVPIIIILLLKALRKDTFTLYFLYSASLGLMLLVSHPQFAFYIFLLVIITSIYGLIKKSEIGQTLLIKKILLILLSTSLGIFLASSQLIPLIELISQSSRSGSVAINTRGVGSLTMSDFSAIFLPAPFHSNSPFQFYMGFFTAIAAIISIFNKKYRIETFIFFFFSLFLIVCILGSNTAIYPLIHKLPGFELFWLPYRMIFLLTFSMSILVSIGIDGLLKRDGKFFFNRILGFILIILISLDIMMITCKKFKSTESKMTKPEVVDFLKTNLADSRCFLNSIPTLATPFKKTNSNSYMESLSSDTNLLFGIPTINAYLPLITQSYLDICPSASALVLFKKNEKEWMTQPISCKALEILNVKYILSYFNFYCPFPIVHTSPDGLKVYFNPKSMGKFFILTEEELLKIESELSGNNKMPNLNKIDNRGKIPAKINQYPSDNTPLITNIRTIKSDYHFRKIEVSSSESAIFINSENFYSGWKAKLDGKYIPIKKRLITLMSLNLPKGKHTIELFFEPFSFKFGCYISYITILIISFFMTISLIRIIEFENHKKLGNGIQSHLAPLD